MPPLLPLPFSSGGDVVISISPALAAVHCWHINNETGPNTDFTWKFNQA